MIKLMQAEWLKIKNYPAFWWVTGITAIAYPAINYSMLTFYKNVLSQPNMSAQIMKGMLGNPFAFNEVWHTVAYFSSWFILFPAIVIIMLITNEYTFKTHKQNIIDGWSRTQFLTAKLINIAIISVLVTLLYSVVAFVIGMNNTSTEDTVGSNKTYYIAYFLLLTFSQLSIAFLIGFLVRKSFIALSIFLFLFLILEPVLTKILDFNKVALGQFLPFEISDRMIPPPGFFGRLDPVAYATIMDNAGKHCIYTVIFTILIWVLCYRLNAKRDF